MININFHDGTVEDFTIVLSDRSHCHKGQIVNIDNFVYRANLNSANEISFTIYKELGDNTEKLWDEIIDLRLVWVKELNEYFEIYVSVSETTGLVKNITGTSLCEAELSQTLLRNIEINTEDDIARDDYVITKFYASSGEGSLLHRVLEKVPHYSIKHVDESLKNLQRTFSINDKSVYDFLTGECAEQFNCLFQFDSVERSISVYDLYTVCTNCGHRGEFNDVCPECDGTDLLYYGDDTTICVSADNLTDTITYNTDVDSIKNCFKLEAGDDNMTAAVVACNPNGSAYLYYFSDEQKRDMPDTLVDKIDSYDELVESYTEEYKELLEGLYDCIDKIIYYQSEMMPTIEIAEVTASTEAAKLTANNLSPIGLTSVTSYTSVATVNSALKNLARVFTKTGFVRVEVDNGTFTYAGTDSNGNNYGNWTGRFKVTNYSDDTDVAYSDTITVRVTSDYNYYLEQKIKKNIANNDSDDGSVFDVLSITNLDNFKNALTYYCYNRLESFADAIQGVIDILIEEKQSSDDSDYYNQFYLPYYDKLTACQSEMDIRSATIKSYEDREADLIKHRNDIHDILDFEAYIGEELYNIFCSYRREDTYKNENYISDGLDNAEIFRKAVDFINVAKQEIVKSGEHQHSIAANLYNLLIMKEFAPIKDYFELGNWIRCKFDNSVYRLRLVSYEVSGSNLSSINTEFSDMTKTASGVNDLKSIIQDAASMASSYSYVAKQASQGDKAQNTLKDFVKDGLNSALINIKNNIYEEVTFDNHGIIAKSYDDISDDYSPEQLRITHNILAFTNDNWKTSSLGLGKHDYHYYDNGVLVKGMGYGLSSKFVQAGFVNGSQIIGGEIYSQNYTANSGTYINLNNGTFSFAGGKMTYDGANLTFKDLTMKWADIEDAPTKISEFENDAKYQNVAQVTQITKDTITAPFIKALNLEVGNHIKMGADATITWGNVSNKPNDLASTGDIPTNISQLKNDSGYQNVSQVTQITKDTVTAPFIKALNLYVGDHIKMGNNATISWGNVSDKPNDLASTGDIPTKVSQLTNDSGYQNVAQVTQITKDTVTAPYVKALNLYVGDHIKMGANATISWSNVTNQPTIPSKTSQLTNDSQYATTSSIPTKVSQLTNDAGYAKTSAIPSKLSQLTNDSQFITASAVPSNNEIVDLILANRGTIITKDYIGTLKVVAGSVAAENITGTTITGKTLTVGGSNNGDGSIVVKNDNGEIVCTIDKNGIKINATAMKYTDDKVILSGSVLASGVKQSGFSVSNNSLFSGCSSAADNGEAPSEPTIVAPYISNIDLTGYSKMTIVSTAKASNDYGTAYVKCGIDSATTQFFTVNDGDYKDRTYTITLDITSYSGFHTLKFYQYAMSDSSYEGWWSVADLGLTSITLSN